MASPKRKKTLITGGPAGAHFAALRESAELIRDCTSKKPAWAMILGSGLSGAVDALEEKIVFPYEGLPGFRATSVEGHPGRLVFGRLGGTWVAAFAGRTHLYEGCGVEPTLAPVRLAHELNIRNIAITNAAGALCPPFRAGHFMPITAHLNLSFQSGEFFYGARPPKCEVYCGEHVRRFTDIALKHGVPALPGVYVALTGPTYETPAETRAYRRLGAHAAGMSTALEAAEAAALGMKVLGVSCITNDASPQGGDSGPTHEQVLAAAIKASDGFAAVMRTLINE